jgi:hypothetical protein
MTFPSPGTAEVDSHATDLSNRSQLFPFTKAACTGRFFLILGIFTAVGGRLVTGVGDEAILGLSIDLEGINMPRITAMRSGDKMVYVPHPTARTETTRNM